MLFLAARSFLVIFVHPIVARLLRLIGKLAPKKNHAAIGAADNVPGVALRKKSTIWRSAERTRSFHTRHRHILRKAHGCSDPSVPLDATSEIPVRPSDLDVYRRL